MAPATQRIRPEGMLGERRADRGRGGLVGDEPWIAPGRVVTPVRRPFVRQLQGLREAALRRDGKRRRHRAEDLVPIGATAPRDGQAPGAGEADTCHASQLGDLVVYRGRDRIEEALSAI